MYNIKDKLSKNVDFILAENSKDIKTAKDNNISDSMIDRLTLTESRLNQIINGIENVANLKDVVNIDIETIIRPNSLKIVKKAVPFGIIAMIFESRP